MPKVDYEHNGVEREYEATTYTLVVYEQEFKRDLIKDVYGRIDTTRGATIFDADGNIVVADYTYDNWTDELRAFWAMLKTSEAICKREKRPCLPIPNFAQWCLETRSIDMGEISELVYNECQRGLFRSGAADSEE